MKAIIYLFLFIILQALPAAAQTESMVRKGNAHPVNIASRLVLRQDSVAIASTLVYYGYEPQPAEDSNSVFRHPDGTTIRFAFTNSGKYRNFPTIQVTTKSSRQEIERILKDLDYYKNGDRYEDAHTKYASFLTKCTIGPANTVTFTRQKKL